MLNWGTDMFDECYNSIKYNDNQPVNLSFLEDIKDDLNAILVTPKKDESSKQKLIDNKSLFEFSNGDKFKLNDQFVENSILLSNELGLNELVAAEVLLYSNTNVVKTGITFIDQGRCVFFKRSQIILNILGYLITNQRLDVVTSDFNKFGDTLLSSFNKVYEIINNLNDLINKQVMTNGLTEAFIDTVNYSKTMLFDLHELLGQLYYNLVENYFTSFGTSNYYNKVLSHLNSTIYDDDSILLHYLPGIFSTISNLNRHSAAEVVQFHKQITQKLSNDYQLVSSKSDLIDLSSSKLKHYEILIDFIFLTNIIPWCKQGNNYEKFHFNEDILNYIQICLNYGVLENLLRFASATADPKTIELFEMNNLCDFRSLLQINFPDLSLKKFVYNDAVVEKRFNLELSTSPVFVQELIPFYWHSFFVNFISHVAIVLTQLRDSEEDFLLSSINKRQRIKDKTDNDSQVPAGVVTSNDSSSHETSSDNVELNMEEIYSRADLERFYLSFVYTYKNRPDLCALVWEDSEVNNDLIGFINWGINTNSSPLITATFCLLLSSLTCKDNLVSTFKIWECLINNNPNLKKTDYSKISMDSIVDSLHYYLNSLKENFENDLNNQLKKRQNRQELLFSAGSTASNNSNKTLIELSEDSIIFISGFVLLISSIVGNLSNTFERSKDIRQNLFQRFKPLIVGFLKFDNLIINSRLSIKSNDAPIILVNDANRSTLVNLMLDLLHSFNDPLGQDLETRYEIWSIVDKWMFHELLDEDSTSNTSSANHSNTTERTKLIKNQVNIKTAFKINLIDLPNVLNFINLIKGLLSLEDDEPNSVVTKLLYPESLGKLYRINDQIGIWPYVEYLMLEVLSKSNLVKDRQKRVALQGVVISFVRESLESIDWKFLNNTLPHVVEGIDHSALFKEKLGYEEFVKLHHSIATLNYLLDEKVYKSIFEIILKGESESLVLNSLLILNKACNLQSIFESIVPKLKSTKTNKGPTTSLVPAFTISNIYYPSTFNSADILKTLSDNIPLIIKLGLLIDSSNEKIVLQSIDILDQINSLFFKKNNDDNLLIKNKLLTIFVNTPDSDAIKHAIIGQFYNGEAEIKFKLLEFLIKDLEQSKGLSCFAHHLLGYEIRGNHLIIDQADQNTFIVTLIKFLVSSLGSVSRVDVNNGINAIDYSYTKMCSLILQIINKLCFFPISSLISLVLLRDFEIEDENLFDLLIKYQFKIDQSTIWGNRKFEEDLYKANEFVNDKTSLLAFFEFFKMRSLSIQYLTMEFHNLSQLGSIYKKSHYLNRLINGDKFLNESHQVLKFLDILNFKFKDFEQFNYQKYSNLNLNLLVGELKDEKELFDSKIIDQIEGAHVFSNQQVREAGEYLVKFVVNSSLKELQLSYLHNWVQLIEVVINDGNLVKDKNQNFILEVLSSILPKINEFFEKDINFSEELISLCVILFNYYEEDNLFIEKSLLLFSTCIRGTISSNSTIELRNDLYIIMNNFLQKSFANKSDEILRKLIEILEKTDIKHLEIICNDSIVNEGSIRVTSVILLESIIHLFNYFSNNYIVDKLIKNNSLLLIIRSIKRIDEILEDDMKDLSIVLYELINFKSVTNLLIRIGQIRLGSSYLIQSELFSIIKDLKFLRIDPDLGMNLKINKINEVNLSLDSTYDFINYYEFLLPVFKLISILLISMGPSYKPSKIQGKELLHHFSKLRSSIIKKDILTNENRDKYPYEKELSELMNQFILIDSLVEI